MSGHMQYEREELAEWYREGKTEISEEKYVPVLLCPPQIPHEVVGIKPRPLQWETSN